MIKTFVICLLLIVIYPPVTLMGANLGTLEGEVYYQGKPCPPNIVNTTPPCNGPYQHYEIAIYKLEAGVDINAPVSKILSDDNGKFRTDLPSGTYLIVVQTGPNPKIHMKAHIFEIIDDRETKLSLRVSTGLR